jgi:hypothetical protein
VRGFIPGSRPDSVNALGIFQFEVLLQSTAIKHFQAMFSSQLQDFILSVDVNG